MKGPYEVKYEKYSGRIYVSKQNGKSTQGFNVAELMKEGTLRVLGYTQRSESKSLEAAVSGVLRSYGWTETHIHDLLGREV